MRLGLLIAATCSCALLATTASWAAPSAADVAVAQRTFDEARALFVAGNATEACVRFAQSQRLDPKLGTLLNLAICHEKIGRVASAWSEFHDARSIATAQGLKDRVQFADDHLAALAPRLAYVRVRMTAESKPKVRLDGEVVDPAALDADIPVDPGAHLVEATWTDGKTWKASVRASTSNKEVVTLPPWVPQAKTGPSPAPPSHGRRTAGLVTMGASLAVAGAGAVFGFMALSARSDAEAQCAASRCAEGRATNDTGLSYAWASNALLGVAGLALVTGGILTLSDLGGTRNVSIGPTSIGGHF